MCSSLCLMDGVERGARGSQYGQGIARLRPGWTHCPPAALEQCLAVGLSSACAARPGGHGGTPSPLALPTDPPPSLLPLFQMGLSTRWGEWVRTPLPRHWSVSMSQQRTTGSPCPPCPPRVTGPPPSCRATRSSSWVGAAGANRASPVPPPSPSAVHRPENDLVHPRVAPCCPALQPAGLILLAEHTNSASLRHWQPQHLLCAQGVGKASCPSPPSRSLTWRQGAGHATPACPAAAPSLPVPWLMGLSSAWAGCSSQGPTTSIPVPTSSTPWRCLILRRVSSMSLGDVEPSSCGSRMTL